MDRVTEPITNSADVIDSRDVSARIDALEAEHQSLLYEANELLGPDGVGVDGPPLSQVAAVAFLAGDYGVAADALEDVGRDDAAEAVRALGEWEGGDEAQELASLTALVNECGGHADWADGATLVRESYWEDYVQKMLQDIGDLPRDLPGHLVIDWEATARKIAQDYSQVDFGGVTYYVRD